MVGWDISKNIWCSATWHFANNADQTVFRQSAFNADEIDIGTWTQRTVLIRVGTRHVDLAIIICC